MTWVELTEYFHKTEGNNQQRSWHLDFFEKQTFTAQAWIYSIPSTPTPLLNGLHFCSLSLLEGRSQGSREQPWFSYSQLYLLNQQQCLVNSECPTNTCWTKNGFFCLMFVLLIDWKLHRGERIKTEWSLSPARFPEETITVYWMNKITSSSSSLSLSNKWVFKMWKKRPAPCLNRPILCLQRHGADQKYI